MTEYREISLKSIFSSILNKIWLIALTAIVFGLVAFLITKYAMTPQYQATIRLYVNNKTEATDSVTSSDVSAAKSLVDTYITIIESNSFIDNVSRSTNLNYSSNQIIGMISAKAVNGTEVFDVSITGPSANECALIGNKIAELAPGKISGIIDGSSVKVIDRAKIPTNPISPNMPKNVLIAFLLGLVLSSIAAVFLYIFDTAIYSEEDINEFCTLPILGVFPDLSKTEGTSYAYSYVRRSAGNE